MTGGSSVLLAGDGVLHDAVGRALAAAGDRVEPVARPDDARGAVLLTATDGRGLGLRTAANRFSLRRGTPWVPVFTEAGTAIVGPVVRPGRPGCATCAETRRAAAREHADERAEIERRFAGRLDEPPHSWVTGAAATVVAAIAAAHVARVGEDLEPALCRVRLADLAVSTHPLLPDPLCPDCGGLPADSADAAVLRPRSRPKRSGYRVARLGDRAEHLRRTFVDAETGVVRGVARDVRSVFPTVSARIGLRDGHGTEVGFGRTLDFESGELAALAEAVERYAGIRPGGRRTTVRGSYRDLAPDALHPPALGLHSDAQYDLPGFRFRRYHDDLVLDWVWAHSFRRAGPVLVPERYAYYGHRHDGGDRPFVYEISNGCALGNCLEEAVFHGLLEVAERDAFLLAWYTRTLRSRVDPDTAADRTVPLMVDRIQDVTGYRVDAFDVTAEQGVPVFWVMAVDERASDRAGTHVAAGCHPEPEAALAGALLELAPLTARSPEAYRTERARALRMLADPDAVTAMHDHAVLYSLPEAFDRLSFLYDAGPTRSLRESFAGGGLGPWQPDLRVDLDRLVRRYLDTGLDVVVVDQTTPEHRAGGLRCVKVVVPGALPMTFGHRHRRTTGLDRLLHVPARLGRAARPLAESELNPHPHPFP
ncbi:hypothetical protein SUDANB95_01959 [Actinosynnema sp. ALI-1.44]